MIIVSNYDFLRNDYEKQFVFEGTLYPTAEHAYQASKVDSPDFIESDKEKAYISSLSVKEARNYAKALDIDVYNWDTRKYFVMKSVLTAKFSDPELQKKLIELSGPIVMHSDRDSFWGYNPDTECGDNNLGVILTEIHDELLFNIDKQTSPESLPVSKEESSGINDLLKVCDEIYNWYRINPVALVSHSKLERLIEYLKIEADNVKKETKTSVI